MRVGAVGSQPPRDAETAAGAPQYLHYLAHVMKLLAAATLVAGCLPSS
jgi:hypothetical protein